jgi:hypothetical protein
MPKVLKTAMHLPHNDSDMYYFYKECQNQWDVLYISLNKIADLC